MRGLLCDELLHFAASRVGSNRNGAQQPTCRRQTCPGPEHLRELADRLAADGERPAAEMLESFGRTLFGRLARGFPAFLVGIDSTVDLIERFDGRVANEVQRFLPDVHLPSLSCTYGEAGTIDVACRTRVDLADFLVGLLTGSIQHFGDALAVHPIPGAPFSRLRLVPVVRAYLRPVVGSSNRRRE